MRTAIWGDFFYKHANSRGKVPGLLSIGHGAGWIASIKW